MRNWRSIFRGETTNCQQDTYGSKSWAFLKKLILHPMMPLLKSGSSYCREKYLWDNKNKDPETFAPSTKEFNKNLFIHGAISYQVESLNSHFESESKRLQIIIGWFNGQKIYRRCSIKKGGLKSFTKFKYLLQSLFINKVAGHSHTGFLL